MFCADGQMREQADLLDGVADVAAQLVGVQSSRTSWPPMRISPDVGSTRRLIIFIVVVLPQPDGPTKTTSSPAGMSQVDVVHRGRGLPGVVLGQCPQLDTCASGVTVEHEAPLGMVS